LLFLGFILNVAKKPKLVLRQECNISVVLSFFLTADLVQQIILPLDERPRLPIKRKDVRGASFCKNNE
jgi:hypothetical protein